MNQRNYQKELEEIIGRLDNRPTLFLHSCCAPCSSYCMEYLREYFEITVFFYNPNIASKEEYDKRLEEQKRLIATYNAQVQTGDFTLPKSKEQMQSTRKAGLIHLEEGLYRPEEFLEMAKGLEQCEEGGARCFSCYELRLREAFVRAKKQGFDYVTTTLTISPLKNAVKLNEIGERLATEIGTLWLPGDFKKKNGYQRSIFLSREFDLYRQNFCGCTYSQR